MLMMRLQRVGRRNDPSYRVVVTDKRTGPKSNNHVALVGSYNPKLDHVQLDSVAVEEWLSHGVQTSDTVHNILVEQGIIKSKKKNVLPKKSPIIDEEAEAMRKAEEEAKNTTDTEIETISNEETDVDSNEEIKKTGAEENSS